MRTVNKALLQVFCTIQEAIYLRLGHTGYYQHVLAPCTHARLSPGLCRLLDTGRVERARQ
jgi:hypothetical protein